MQKKAFTLIETLIGITLITVVMTAVTGLVLSTISANSKNTHTLQALSFAEEGVEAMRYIRDSNWRQNYSWDGGETLWGANFDLSETDPITLYLTGENCPPCWGLSGDEEDGVVTNDKGFEFLRTVGFASVYDEDALARVEDTAEVTVTVSWSDHGFERSVDLSTLLTGWQ